MEVGQKSKRRNTERNTTLTMRIKIVKSTHELYWYSNEIGTEYDVFFDEKIGQYRIVNEKNKVIQKQDIEILKQ